MQWVVIIHRKKVIDGIIHNHKTNQNNFYKIFGNKEEIFKIIEG